MRIVTGQEEYTLDVRRTESLLHLAVLGSPHPHARITAIDTAEAEAFARCPRRADPPRRPGVLFSTGRHESRLDDPDDTRVFDRVLRFRGNASRPWWRTACGSPSRRATCSGSSTRSCRACTTSTPPAVREPRCCTVTRPPPSTASPSLGATSSRAARRDGRRRGRVRVGRRDRRRHVDDRTGLARRHSRRTRPVARSTRDGRLVLRTATQVPFLVRDEIAHVFGLDPDRVRVVAKRVGGGFGGKQELLTEDLVTLAVLRTGRTVQYEFSRRDEFTIAPTRHPMRVRVRLAAAADGTLTAMHVDQTMDTAPTATTASASCSTPSASRSRSTAARRNASTPSRSTRTTCRPGRSAGTASASRVRDRVGDGRPGTGARHRPGRPPTAQRGRARGPTGRDRPGRGDRPAVGGQLRPRPVPRPGRGRPARPAARVPAMDGPPLEQHGRSRGGCGLGVRHRDRPRGHRDHATAGPPRTHHRRADRRRTVPDRRRHRRVRERDDDGAHPARRDRPRHHAGPCRRAPVRHRCRRARHRRVRLRRGRRRRAAPCTPPRRACGTR